MVVLNTSSASDRVGFPRRTVPEGWVRLGRGLQCRSDICLHLYYNFISRHFGTESKIYSIFVFC